MTALSKALGRVPPETILVAGAVGFFIAAIALVTAADGLALAWAAIPASSSCSLWDCVGEAINILLALPGLFFGTSSVAATVGGTLATGGIGGATYGDGLGSGGSMGTEGERPPGGDRWMERDSAVYDNSGNEVPGIRIPAGTDVTPTRTIYAPNGNPMFHRVVVGGKLPPGVPRTGWVRAEDTRPHSGSQGTLGAIRG